MKHLIHSERYSNHRQHRDQHGCNKRVQPAAEIVAEMMSEAQHLIRQEHEHEELERY